jgi:hypothetical protein
MLKISSYDGNAASRWKPYFTMPVRPKSPPRQPLRSKRGNLAAKYDPNAANIPKSLRRQFGSFYDGRKVGNTDAQNSVL